MNLSTKKDILKTYGIQSVSLILRFASFTIVIPIISGLGNIYGIYTLASSFLIIIGYLDFGFLRAAQKYSAREYNEGNFDSESKIVANGGLIYLFTTAMFAVFLIIAAFKPNIIISDLTKLEIHSASKIFFLISLGILIGATQRVLNLFLENRIRVYLYNQASILMSIFNIGIAIYLNSRFNEFPLILFLFFTQLTSLVTLLLTLLFSRGIGIDYRSFLSNISFDTEMFNRLKSLALNNFLTSLLWLVFIELDLLFIGKFWGSNDLQLFSPLVTIFGILKYLTSMVFSPITIRIYQSNGRLSSIKKDIDKYGSLVFSLILFASISLTSNGSSFIISWIGEDFKTTGQALGIVGLYYALSPFSYIFSSYLLATENVKILYKLSFIKCSGFWIILMLVYQFMPQYFTLQTFVFTKLMMFFYVDFYSLFNMHKLKLFRFSPKYIIKLLIASGGIIIVSTYLNKSIVVTQSFMNFVLQCSILASLTIVAWIIFNHSLIKGWIIKNLQNIKWLNT